MLYIKLLIQRIKLCKCVIDYYEDMLYFRENDQIRDKI